MVTLICIGLVLWLFVAPGCFFRTLLGIAAFIGIVVMLVVSAVQ